MCRNILLDGGGENIDDVDIPFSLHRLALVLRGVDAVRQINQHTDVKILIGREIDQWKIILF